MAFGRTTVDDCVHESEELLQSAKSSATAITQLKRAPTRRRTRFVKLWRRNPTLLSCQQDHKPERGAGWRPA
jgi:hypothetical protein